MRAFFRRLSYLLRPRATGLVVCSVGIGLLSGCGFDRTEYAVTRHPLDVGVGAKDLCFAAASSGAGPMLWWHGIEGTCSRVNATQLFRVKDVRVARQPAYMELSFPMMVIDAPGNGRAQSEKQLTLRIDSRNVTSVETGAVVEVERRSEL